MTEDAKTEDQLNLDTLFTMLDTALTSSDPRVQAALRQLLIIAALTKNNNSEGSNLGPLRTMAEEIIDTNRRVTALEMQLQMLTSKIQQHGLSKSTTEWPPRGYSYTSTSASGTAISAVEYWNKHLR